MSRNPKARIEIISKEWMDEKLPDEEVNIDPDMLPDDDEEDDVKECLHDVDKKWHETGMTLVGLENDDK